MGKVNERDIERILDMVGLGEKKDLFIIISRWEEIVGKLISSRTKVLDLTEDGILLVEVNNSTWLTELRFMSYEILKKIREETGKEIKFIRFKIRRNSH